MRVEVRVQPGARSTSVGGLFDGALVVRVAEAPEKGRATSAALRALADALGVPVRDVRLVSGATSRRKTVEIDVGSSHSEAARERAEAEIQRRMEVLRHAGMGERAGTKPAAPSSRGAARRR